MQTELPIKGLTSTLGSLYWQALAIFLFLNRVSSLFIKWKVTYVRLVKFKLNFKCNNLPPCTVSVYPQKINNRFVPYKEEFDNHGWKLHLLSVYSYFKRGCRKKCACDNPKGNMGYYQHTVPETIAVEPTFVAFLSHSQTYVHGLSCHSFKFL